MTHPLPPLETFPPVEDFAIILSEHHEEGGKHIEFVSASRGMLAHFPAWDHADRDLRHFIPSDVPIGTLAEWYEDRDIGWRIVIFESGGWVYVAEGDDPRSTNFVSFFRVPRDRYFAAWAALIDIYNPITPLDDPPAS
jgi:hypothetical protein